MGKNSNSGVEGASGYTFQRCCVVYLIFEGFDYLKSADYFICMEHHEDFLFAFIDEKGHLQKIDTYQAKKSRGDWKTDIVLCEIIGKITLVGKELVNDSHPKSDEYEHTLNFLTNKNILLQNKRKTGEKQESEKVQITNKTVNYQSLHKKIKTEIQSKIIDGENSDFDQLDNVNFKFIDLPQGNKDWQRTLTGLSTEVLGQVINDHEAVVTTLMKLLQDFELVYNDNNIVLLADKTKRLTKIKIDTTFSMFKASNKSFKLWRRYADQLSKELDIKLPIQRKAKELLENCFDYFKDIQQIEYKKIYKFVKNNTDIDAKHVSESDCIVELYKTYMGNHKPRLEFHMVAFAVIAAYVETRGMHV